MNPGQTVLTLLLVLIVVLTQGYLHMKVSFFNSKVKTLLKNWRTLPDGFSRPIDSSGKLMTKRPRKPKNLFRINTLDELHEKIRLGYRVNDLDVRGDIHNHLLNTSEIHPVVQLMHDRKASFSTPNNRTDSCKVAIALEGGGMRGCVNAGMITAIWYLGLQNSVDVIYGSSAGSLVGAYFLSKQLPYYGPEVYYDVLTSSGKDFIDTQNILRSCGLGVFDLRIKSLTNLITDKMGRPVLNLNFLFETIVKRIKPLDFQTLNSSAIPLKIVASGLLSHRSVILSQEGGNFYTLNELTQCMKASMLLPGITGNPIYLTGRAASGKHIYKPTVGVNKSEPMCDALLYEPVPYRSAVKEGATHVVCMRTRADDVNVCKKMSLLEKMIMSRFFGRKLMMPSLVHWMHNQYHKLIYAEDILRINAANRDFSPDLHTQIPSNNVHSPGDINSKARPSPRLYGVALPAGTKEVSRTETSREVIFDTVRRGFAAAFDSLVLDPAERGRGYEVAKTIWPDSILFAPPAHLITTPMQHLVATNSADTVANASLNVYDGESIHTEDYESARTGNSIYMEEGIQMPVRAEGMSLQSKKTQSLPVVKQKKLLQILGKIRGFLARNSH